MSRVHRFIDVPSLEPFFKGVDDFVSQHLFSFSLVDQDFSHKIFADPIEGYARLTPWEVALLDTPLFQRLRHIKQLGLAFLVYPTLGYSRFEHTLGVLSRLQQVIDAIKDNQSYLPAPEYPKVPLDDSKFFIIRLAALCHDVGHCLFSHVSEPVLESLLGIPEHYPSSPTIIREFSAYAGRRIPMAEIFTVCIVNSPAFINYLDSIPVFPVKGRSNVQEFVRSASDLILGRPIKNDPSSLFLAQLMSSGFDVDKLDYMFRESHLSGISLGISLGWLMKKIFLKDLLYDNLPLGLKTRLNNFPSRNKPFTVLSIDCGGQFAFEEFCVARLALHEKIYLHQKIRAAEAQLRVKLSCLQNNISLFSKAHMWLFLKESLLDHPDVDLPGLPERDLLNMHTPRTMKVADVTCVAQRRLLHRAYAFGWQNSIAEPETDIKRSETPTDAMIRDIHSNPAGFIQNIRKVIKSFKNILGEHAPDIFTAVETADIIVDHPRINTIQQGIDTIYFEHPSRSSVKWTIPIDKIVEYYHNNRALGYVFSTKNMLPYVLLAAEIVAWKKYGVLCIQDALVNDKVIQKADDLKKTLYENDYYVNMKELQPISEVLSFIESQNIITSIAVKLAPYESRSKRRVSPASITTYVSQFPEKLQQAALSWLTHIQWIEPDEGIKRAILKTFDTPCFKGVDKIAICPLGAMTDSASRIAYDLRDIQNAVHGKYINTMTLNDALGDFDGYILYDDNTNSGLQAMNIMAGWLGIELPAEKRLKEEHVQKLTAKQIIEIRSKPVGLVFAVSTEHSKKVLRDAFSKIMKFDDDKYCINIDRVINDNERIFSGAYSEYQHSDLNILRQFLEDVARQISCAEGKSLEHAEKKLLGYGNAEAMVVFPYNVPTMTVTALWIRGTYNNAEWIPLVERGRRLNPKSGEFIGEDA